VNAMAKLILGTIQTEGQKRSKKITSISNLT